VSGSLAELREALNVGRKGPVGTRRGWRAWAPFVVLGVAILALALLTGRGEDRGLPLDPSSTGPLGTKALVDVLREVGADLEVTDDLPGDRVDTALVLVDEYDDAQREELLDWARAGGVLVVADAQSPLQPEAVDTTSLPLFDASIARDCDLAALKDVERASAPGGTVHEVPAGATGCFPRNDGSWLVARAEGDGAVVTLGGAGALTNAELSAADNGLLAVVLLAPDGDGTVAFLRPPGPGGGDTSLTDLIPVPLRFAFLQLLLAFLVVAAWRARRLGRPVTEPLPVEVPGSELVAATGNLFQTARAGGHAAAILRADAARRLAERLGLPPDAAPEQVAEAAAARTGADRDEVLALLRGGGPVDEATLVALAQSVESVRRATLEPVRQPQDPGAVRVR
jgi:hypothetical protein